MLPLGCWIYPSLGSTVYYMLNNDLPEFGLLDAWDLPEYSVLYGNRA